MFKCNMKLTRTACWNNSKMNNWETNVPHSWYFYLATIVGHHYSEIVESL